MLDWGDVAVNRPAVSFFVVGLLSGLLIATAGFALVTRTIHTGALDAGVTLLRLGHGLDARHPVHAGMVYMAERLAELSDGAVRMDIFPNEQLGTEVQTMEQVQRGVLDLTKTSTAAMEGFLPEMAVFGIPYLFEDEAHAWRVLEGDLGRELLAKGESRGMIGLCYYDAGSRSFYTRDTPILTPDDLQGMLIRVQQSRMAMSMVSALGGSPTPVPWGELYTALQQGQVDGAENNPPSFYGSRHFEVCKHYSLDEHTTVPDILVISASTWERLPPHVRAWVQQAADESAIYQRQLWAEETQASMEGLREAGVTIHYPDKTACAEQVREMHEELAQDALLGDLMQRVEAER
jgi:tripartite ATP-independent transporter DctP family solute receptor